jgi:hypothetical protein
MAAGQCAGRTRPCGVLRPCLAWLCDRPPLQAAPALHSTCARTISGCTCGAGGGGQAPRTCPVVPGAVGLPASVWQSQRVCRTDQQQLYVVRIGGLAFAACVQGLTAAVSGAQRGRHVASILDRCLQRVWQQQQQQQQYDTGVSWPVAPSLTVRPAWTAVPNSQQSQ